MAAKKSKKSKPESNDDSILELAKSRFALAEDAWRDIKIKALDDEKFVAGEQWPEELQSDRDQDGRPCLVINRLPQQVKQVTNDQRQNRPAINVNPVDSDGDVEIAEILQGIIRHIEYASSADTAYDLAFLSACRHSFGFFRILTDYVSPISFEQEIKIKAIKDSFSVLFDPSSQEIDGSDANWAFVSTDMTKEEYEAAFPDSKLTDMSDWNALGNQVPDWIRGDGCRVVEYFYKEHEVATICLMSDGSVVEKSKLPSELPDGIEVQEERQTKIPKIKWCKLNGLEVLDKTEWPGRWIPIVPVYGDELIINGRRILESVIRHAKDPQRMYNYWRSSQTETIALAPRAPFIGAAGQFEGYEALWKAANRKSIAYLEFNATPESANGQVLPAPQRQVFEPPVQAITQACMQAADEIKATTGIYDAALGNQSNENSGIAIQRRNSQSQTANFNFIDNLSKSIAHAGRILIDLIPKIYDTPRAVRIVKPDDEQEVVWIHQIFDRNGKQAFYDISLGQYDVTVSVGPSFQTKRQEAVASMIDLSKSAPQIMQAAPDLIVKNMDWPYSKEIAERLKRTLPPQIAGDDNQQQQVPPQVQQQMAQMNQMIQQLTEHLNAATEMINTKKIELESKERIEFAKIQSSLEIALAQQHSDEAQALLKADIDSIKHRIDMFGDIFQQLNTGGEPSQVQPGNQQQTQAPGVMPEVTEQ